jgi:hypothetical protein
MSQMDSRASVLTQLFRAISLMLIQQSATARASAMGCGGRMASGYMWQLYDFKASK